MKLRDKVALITGGSRGIGKAIALQLAAEGATVLIQYAHNEAAAIETKNTIEQQGGKAFIIQADFEKETAIPKIYDFVTTFLKDKKIDIFIHNVGILIKGNIQSTMPESFDKLFLVNVKQPFFLTQQLLPLLNYNGRMVFISSNLALRPRPDVMAYSMTKAAINNFVIGLAKELGQFQITVNAIGPSATETDMNKERFQDPSIKKSVAELSVFNRIAQPNDIASIAAFLCLPEANWVTGQFIEASGGIGL